MNDSHPDNPKPKSDMLEMSVIITSLSNHPQQTSRMFYQAAVSDKASAGSERQAYVPLHFIFSYICFRTLHLSFLEASIF